jgi:enoyl-CoA hydratase
MFTYDDYKSLDVTRDADVLTVTMNPGTPLNVINAQMHTDLATIFDRIREDTSVLSVVLTGSGSAFCGGADLYWLRENSEELDLIFREARHTILAMLELPQPIIAAIEGPAIGLGATLALFCDIKIAATDAKIGDPHVRVGLVAGDGGAVIWPWLVGGGRAKRYLLTGDLINATDARDMGLIDETAEPGDAIRTAQALAARIGQNSMAAVRGTKLAVNKLLSDSANLALDLSLALEKETKVSQEHHDAVDAFLARSR